MKIENNFCKLDLSYYGILLLAISTTLIAAGGYIINDYFDVKIDEINKPKRVTVELKFKRRNIMFAHIILNIVAIIIVIPLAIKAHNIKLISIQIFSILLLIFYSSHFKRQALIGNLVVAFLTALNVLTPAIYEYQIFYYPYINNIYAVTFFAFTLTLIREIVKDLEDLKGDEADGCRTLPIVYGINTSKNIIYFLCVLIILFCIYILFTTSQSVLFIILFPFFCALILSILYFNKKLYNSKQHKDYKYLSRFLKIITFIGILFIFLI